MISKPSSEYADVTDMFRRLATFDPQTIQYLRQRDAIIERCLPLADHIARRFRNRGEPLEDLVQVARVGLMNAVNRFDVDNGAEFIAFAVPTIMGEVRRHFRDHGWSVKVPRRLKELNAQLKRCREELSHELGRAPTASEIAAKLGIDRDEVVQAQIASSAYSTLSSDAPAGARDDDDARSVTNTIGDLDANLDKVLDVATVRPLLGGTARTRADSTYAPILREHDADSDRRAGRDLADACVAPAGPVFGRVTQTGSGTGTRLSGNHFRTRDDHQVWPYRRGVTDGCELKPPS